MRRMQSGQRALRAVDPPAPAPAPKDVLDGGAKDVPAAGAVVGAAGAGAGAGVKKKKPKKKK